MNNNTPEYRIMGDLSIKDVSEWLKDSPLAHIDESIFLNWRIVNKEGRTVVAFAGGCNNGTA